MTVSVIDENLEVDGRRKDENFEVDGRRKDNSYVGERRKEGLCVDGKRKGGLCADGRGEEGTENLCVDGGGEEEAELSVDEGGEEVELSVGGKRKKVELSVGGRTKKKKPEKKDVSGMSKIEIIKMETDEYIKKSGIKAKHSLISKVSTSKYGEVNIFSVEIIDDRGKLIYVTTDMLESGNVCLSLEIDTENTNPYIAALYSLMVDKLNNESKIINRRYRKDSQDGGTKAMFYTNGRVIEIGVIGKYVNASKWLEDIIKDLRAERVEGYAKVSKMENAKCYYKTFELVCGNTPQEFVDRTFVLAVREMKDKGSLINAFNGSLNLVVLGNTTFCESNKIFNNILGHIPKFSRSLTLTDGHPAEMVEPIKKGEYSIKTKENSSSIQMFVELPKDTKAISKSLFAGIIFNGLMGREFKEQNISISFDAATICLQHKLVHLYEVTGQMDIDVIKAESNKFTEAQYETVSKVSPEEFSNAKACVKDWIVLQIANVGTSTFGSLVLTRIWRSMGCDVRFFVELAAEVGNMEKSEFLSFLKLMDKPELTISRETQY